MKQEVEGEEGRGMRRERIRGRGREAGEEETAKKGKERTVTKGRGEGRKGEEGQDKLKKRRSFKTRSREKSHRNQTSQYTVDLRQLADLLRMIWTIGLVTPSGIMCYYVQFVHHIRIPVTFGSPLVYVTISLDKARVPR